MRDAHTYDKAIIFLGFRLKIRLPFLVELYHLFVNEIRGLPPGEIRWDRHSVTEEKVHLLLSWHPFTLALQNLFKFYLLFCKGIGYFFIGVEIIQDTLSHTPFF